MDPPQPISSAQFCLSGQEAQDPPAAPMEIRQECPAHGRAPSGNLKLGVICQIQADCWWVFGVCFVFFLHFPNLRHLSSTFEGSVLPKMCPGWAGEAPRTASCPPAAHYRMLLLIQVFNTVIGLVIVERKRHLVALWCKAFPIEKGCDQTYLIRGECFQSHLQTSDTKKSQWLLFFGSVHATCLACEKAGFRAGITSSPPHVAWTRCHNSDAIPTPARPSLERFRAGKQILSSTKPFGFAPQTCP